MPYHELPGAFWAILGPAVELKRTEYDLQETIRGYRASGDPMTNQMIETALTANPVRGHRRRRTTGVLGMRAYYEQRAAEYDATSYELHRIGRPADETQTMLPYRDVCRLRTGRI